MALLSIFRVVAMLLLLGIGGEMLLCEMMDASECSHFHEEDAGGTDAAGHQCFCSSSHVVIASFGELGSTVPITPADCPETLAGIDRPPASIYHPPKA